MAQANNLVTTRTSKQNIYRDPNHPWTRFLGVWKLVFCAQQTMQFTSLQVFSGIIKKKKNTISFFLLPPSPSIILICFFCDTSTLLSCLPKHTIYIHNLKTHIPLIAMSRWFESLWLHGLQVWPHTWLSVMSFPAGQHPPQQTIRKKKITTLPDSQQLFQQSSPPMLTAELGSAQGQFCMLQ